ncbi:hypothetical protein CTU88_44055 [Streptomyces sp. JV178]|nr:hypothetical protein CTU88_44055 [Streptomyces sp. JV178]
MAGPNLAGASLPLDLLRCPLHQPGLGLTLETNAFGRLARIGTSSGNGIYCSRDSFVGALQRFPERTRECRAELLCDGIDKVGDSTGSATPDFCQDLAEDRAALRVVGSQQAGRSLLVTFADQQQGRGNQLGIRQSCIRGPHVGRRGRRHAATSLSPHLLEAAKPVTFWITQDAGAMPHYGQYNMLIRSLRMAQASGQGLPVRQPGCALSDRTQAGPCLVDQPLQR